MPIENAETIENTETLETLKTLENETWRLAVSPAHGGGVVELRGRLSGRALTPVMRETPPDAVEAGRVSSFSSFLMAPYSNRIRQARFSFGGELYALRPTTREGNAMHGDVRARPWEVKPSERGGEVIELGFDSRRVTEGGGVNFPFPFAITLGYELDGDVFMTSVELQNVGPSPMPAGFGLHPYFVRKMGGSEDVALGFRAEGVYETGPELIPDGPRKKIPSELDFSTPRSLGDQKLDHVFGGWDGRATLAWKRAGAELVIEADPVFSHLVIYTAPDGTLAVEPVTHATDGFNLLARGVAGTGVRVLEPGEVMRGAVRLRFASREGAAEGQG